MESKTSVEVDGFVVGEQIGTPLRLHANAVPERTLRPDSLPRAGIILELMTARETARMLGATPTTFKYWRLVGRGPVPYKIGGR